jgi:succinyl-diaminopimelate desuccinylase
MEPALREFSVVELTRELVRLNSVNPPGNELQVAELIAGYAERNGLEATLRPFVPG